MLYVSVPQGTPRVLCMTGKAMCLLCAHGNGKVCAPCTGEEEVPEKSQELGEEPGPTLTLTLTIGAEEGQGRSTARDISGV